MALPKGWSIGSEALIGGAFDDGSVGVYLPKGGFKDEVIPYECEQCGLTFDALTQVAVMAQDKLDLPVPCCSEDCKTQFEVKE